MKLNERVLIIKTVSICEDLAGTPFSLKSIQTHKPSFKSNRGWYIRHSLVALL